MSTVTSDDHHNSQLLPPSPPPSPPSTRQRQRKRQDSFEKLANTPIPSPPGSPTHGPIADDNEDSSLRKIILTPFLFVSFILSLSFINLRDRAHRTYANSANSNTSILAYLSPSSWWDAEPYQDPDDSRWGMRGAATHVGPDDAISPSQGGQKEGGKKRKKSWHLNKKIRKVVKLEVSDAFEMSGKVMLGMCAFMVVGSVVFWMSAKWMLGTMTSMLS